MILKDLDAIFLKFFRALSPKVTKTTPVVTIAKTPTLRVCAYVPANQRLTSMWSLARHLDMVLDTQCRLRPCKKCSDRVKNSHYEKS